MKTRSAAALLLAGAIVLTYYAWRTGAGDGGYSLKAAVMGPVLIGLACGLLIHGDALFHHVTPLMRSYGLLGAALAAINVYLLGLNYNDDFASRMTELVIPALMAGLWLVPRGGARK